jgi:hypothetical protein
MINAKEARENTNKLKASVFILEKKRIENLIAEAISVGRGSIEIESGNIVEYEIRDWLEGLGYRIMDLSCIHSVSW